MSKCQHSNVQQFTEICLDCGHNIYETDEEYEESLKQEIEVLKNEVRQVRISKLENEKEALLKELGKGNDDDNSGGW